MAKKSLKKRIDDLVDALGGAEKPTVPKIRSELVAIGTLMQDFEDGQALAEKEAAITALETENENLKVELKSATEKIEAFAAERKKQEEKKWEIIPIQLEILLRLPSEHGGTAPRLDNVAHALGIPIDEAEIHFEHLRTAGLITSHYNEPAGVLWRRTMEGNKLAVAKRRVDEAEGQKPYKHKQLPEIQQKILQVIAREPDKYTERDFARMCETRLPLIRRELRLLREAEMATDEEVPGNSVVSAWVDGPGTYADDSEPYSPTWRILGKGEDYLAERELL